jgi:YD repeat-containing protein
VTQVTDTDGHATKYTFDALGRVTQRQAWQGIEYLTSTSAWDTQNNLIATTDPRGYETDYAYDANGNTIAVALPLVTTSQGSFRPTSLYSYDVYNGVNENNVTAYCDPVHVGAAGYNWTNRPQSDTLCVNGPGATRYSWDHSDSNDPFGRLSDTYTPLGYHHQILYSTGVQGGDYGLPSDVIGDIMPQQDGTNRSPHQTFAYDSHGNLSTYNKGYGSWALAYDTLNRPISTTDPDSVTARTCYFNDGQAQATQSAAQYALDSNTLCGSHSASFIYDADGNETSETHHLGGVTGVTTKYYDGDDRLVEVSQPHDSVNDAYPYAWMTRYLYDLSQNATVSIGSVSGLYAHGNLYQTQEYLPSTTTLTLGGTLSSPMWMPVRGTSFDTTDRALASYELAFGNAPKLTNIYDAAPNYGLMTQSQNATGATTTPTYDYDGHVTADTFSGDGGLTPNRTSTFDPDGRETTLSSTTFTGEGYTYDVDGNLATHTDPSGANYTSPATETYAYYGDGERKTVSIASTALNATNALAYSYRNDGALQTETSNYGGAQNYAWTYTPAGRELTQSDPYTGNVISLYTVAGSPNGTRTLAPRTTTYDAYGRVATLTLPEGYEYTTFAYDADDETDSYTRTGGYPFVGAGSEAYAYSVRGEMVSSRSNPHSGTGYTVTTKTANGYQCMDCGPGALYDARSSMVLGNGYLVHPSGPPATSYQGYGYDATGRNVTQTSSYLGTNTTTRAYDAENHLVSQTYAGSSGEYNCPLVCGFPAPNITLPLTFYPNGSGVSYGYGPSGHVELSANTNGAVSGSTWYDQLHWDGNSILFEQAYPSFITLEVDDLAGAYSGGSMVYDRDMSGNIVAVHDGSDFGVWNDAPGNKVGNTKTGGTVSIGETGANPGDPTPMAPLNIGVMFAPSREDGYADEWGNVFQGVRVYDPIMAQWTAPDAYAGDVHDPMSQKPFMWNNNNPLDFQDPSGYESGGCSINVNDCGITLPSNTDFYAKAEASGLGLAFSGTATASGTKYFSTPSQQGITGARSTPGLLRAAVAGVSGAAARAVGSTFGAYATVGLVLPNNGKKSTDVIGGKSTTISISAEGVTVEFGWNSNGKFVGIGVGTPGAGVTTTYGRPLNPKKAPPKAASH